MNNVKKKKATILVSKNTHLFVFFYPLAFLLLSLYYLNLKEKSSVIIIAGTFLFLVLQYYFMYYKKKIIVSEKKIYIYSKGKQVSALDLVNDFLYINYESGKVGYFLNFGTLIIVNKNKESFTYYYLKDPKIIYDTVVKQYEINMKTIDPSYELSYNSKDMTIDSIDTIDDKQEKL